MHIRKTEKLYIYINIHGYTDTCENKNLIKLKIENTFMYVYKDTD